MSEPTVWHRWRISMLLYGVSMVICGAFAAALLLTPSAQAIKWAHQRGYDEAMAACEGPSRLERAAKWVAR